MTYVNIEETTVSGKFCYNNNNNINKKEVEKINYLFSFTGKCQCLVQLSVLPVAVCHGTGSTSSEAQSDSALNALEYLKIMTKK